MLAIWLWYWWEDTEMDRYFTLCQTAACSCKQNYQKSGLSCFNLWVSYAPKFHCCYFCESSGMCYLSFNSDFYVSKIMDLRARTLQRKPYNLVSKEPRQSKGRGLVVRELVEAPPPCPVILLLTVPGRPFCFFFCFFCEFRRGMLLFIGKNRC